MLWAALGYNLWFYWNPAQSYSPPVTIPIVHWQVGMVFIIDFVTVVLGIVLFFTYRAIAPPYFKGEVLNKDTPTLVPEAGQEVGLFGIDESEPPAGLQPA